MSNRDPEQIKDLIESLKRSAWDIEQQILGICYHMPSVTYENAWGMSSKERDTTIKYINKRIEAQNEANKG
jgi:hypothetical protein